MHWATSDVLGVIAFATTAQALRTHPDTMPVRCEFAFGFLGWLALVREGTDNGRILKTPDGREINVVSGYTSKGRLIGMRGGLPRSRYSEEWRAIMVRVVDAGLALHEYRQRGKG